jgi:hypothetical protein
MPKKAVPAKRPRGEQKKADTIRKRQDTQKMKLLEILEESPNIGTALSRIGINRSTYSRWRTSDSVFTMEADKAIERGIEKTADLVEMALLNVARDGNVQAQKYYLGNNHKRYRTNRYGEPEVEGLSEERKMQITAALKAWSEGSYDDYADERDSDYVLERDENGKLIEFNEPTPKNEGPKYDDEGYLIT